MATNTKKKAVVTEDTAEINTEEAEHISEPEEVVDEEKEALYKRLAELEQKLAEAQKTPVTPAATQIPSFIVPTTDVTLVYMSESLGVINMVPGVNIVCSRYGEEFILPRSVFDQVVGAYRGWFDEGILAVSHRNMDVAAAKGLRTDDEYAIKPAVLKKLGTISTSELEKLWNSCTTDSERLSIVQYFKRKYMEGREPGYRDANRVLKLNQLSSQGLKREAIEISGGDLAIHQTDFMK